MAQKESIRCPYIRWGSKETFPNFIKDSFKIAPLEDKLRETRLKWFGQLVEDQTLPSA